MVLASILGLKMFCGQAGLTVAMPDPVDKEALERDPVEAAPITSSTPTTCAATFEHGIVIRSDAA